MAFLKWLHRRTSAKPIRDSEDFTQEGGSSSTDEIDLAANPILDDAVSCARHALIMEFRDANRFDPTPEDLAEWAGPFWQDRDSLKAIIRSRNGMALSLGERFPTFWERLECRIFRGEER